MRPFQRRDWPGRLMAPSWPKQIRARLPALPGKSRSRCPGSHCVRRAGCGKSRRAPRPPPPSGRWRPRHRARRARPPASASSSATGNESRFHRTAESRREKFPERGDKSPSAGCPFVRPRSVRPARRSRRSAWSSRRAGLRGEAGGRCAAENRSVRGASRAWVRAAPASPAPLREALPPFWPGRCPRSVCA